MANVLLTWEMGGGAGHCVKLVPVAQRLTSAGHQVSFAARNLVAAKRLFASLPITYFQAPYLAEKPANRINWPRTLAQILHNTRFGDDQQLDVLVRTWRALYEEIQPDMVICDYSPTALLASRWHTHRRVVLGTGFELPPRLSPLPDLEYWRTDKLDFVGMSKHESDVLDRANKLLRTDGVQPLDHLADLFADVNLSFLLTFAELDHYRNRPSAKYWGTWSLSGGCVPKWPNNTGPRVFGYLKPPRPRWELGGLLSILRAQPMATIIYAPGADLDWLQQYESPSLQFVHNPVNIKEISNGCDAAILNANAGAVSEFLLHGVPLLNIPLHLEQLVTARRVSDLGAGLIAAAPRPQAIADQLMTLLSTSKYCNSATAFARKYSNFNPDQAIDRIVAKINELLSNA